MFKVPNLEVNIHFRKIVGNPHHCQCPDIAVTGSYRLRHFCQSARFIDGIHRNARVKSLAASLVHIPAHVDPAVWLVIIFGQHRRLDRIDCDALSRLHDADDTVSGHSARCTERNGDIACRTTDRQGIGSIRRLFVTP